MNSRRNLSQVSWRVAVVLWGIATVSGWVWTTRYEFTTHADNELNSPEQWPPTTNLALAENRDTLLVFVHPRCPCTSASIHELRRILTAAGLSKSQQPKSIVVAALPANAAHAWRETDTLRRASELPRAETFWDVGGTESRRFGAVTSGDVRLFDQDGQLLFSGGVTASRGHQGENIGGDRLNVLLSQRSRTRQKSTPVFGCQLCVEPGLSDGDQACLTGLPSVENTIEGAAR